MNANTDTDFVFSFKGFCRRGGETDKHKDGWGISFFEGRGIRTFLDSRPAASSPIASLLTSYPCKTLNMISHIRLATSGTVCLENVHPFQRELWGINFCFCHNGDVPKFHCPQEASQEDSQEERERETATAMPYVLNRNTSNSSFQSVKSVNSVNDLSNEFITHANYNVERARSLDLQKSPLKNFNSDEKRNDLRYTPVGNTDSEAVFCFILNSLFARFSEPPSLFCLHVFLKELCNQIVAPQPGKEDQCIIFNFLLCVGEFTQFAFCYPGTRPGSTVYNGLHYIIRKHPFHVAALSDADVCVNFEKVTTENDRVAVIATKPLTKDEDWQEMSKGELILFNLGDAYSLSESDANCCEDARENDRDILDLKHLIDEPVESGSTLNVSSSNQQSQQARRLITKDPFLGKVKKTSGKET